MSVRLTLLAAAAAFAVSAAPANAYMADFTSYVGQSTPLTVPSGDDTLTFSSPTDPGTFSVGSTVGLFSFATGMGDFSSFGGDTLDIAFAQPETSVRMPFGLEDAFGLFGSDTLTVTTNTGQTETFGTGLDGLTLDEPEGVAQLVGAPFTSLTITSADPFALASVSVPEPMSITAISVGLIGLAAARRRR